VLKAQSTILGILGTFGILGISHWKNLNIFLIICWLKQNGGRGRSKNNAGQIASEKNPCDSWTQFEYARPKGA
jgi:hypothetical protein